MKISFLIHNRYAIGGVIKSTVNLAAALSERHQVEMVSLIRDRQQAAFSLKSGVDVLDLVDLRPTAPSSDAEHPLHQKPVQVFPAKDGMRSVDNSRLVEVRLAQYLAATDADVVVSCHPGIAVCLGRIGGDFLKIAQIHQASYSLGTDQRAALLDASCGLDALLSVSAEDTANLRRIFSRAGVHTASIPNCIPPMPGPPSDGHGRTIMAAGRLDKGKRYDTVVRAFASLADRHPTWRLRIYGRGPEHAALHSLVGALDLHDQILLMGASDHMDQEWPKGDIAVSASASECLPMNIIEAMAAGLPVVSTDCDYGPREIITHGKDGLLVPVDDADSLSEAIQSLMEDPDRRGQLADAARRTASRYSPQGIAARYEALFETLEHRRNLPGKASWNVHENGDVAIHVDALAQIENLRLICRNAADETETGIKLHPAPSPENPSRQTGVLERNEPSLPEGHWDLYTSTGDEASQRRLQSQNFDNRYLTRLDGPRGVQPFHTLVPLVDERGGLSVRSWARPTHAEADRVIREGNDGFTVMGRLWGVNASADAEVILRGRRNSELNFTVPANVEPNGCFRFTVPVHALIRRRATEHDVWDLWLVPAPDTEPVRIGRFLGDYTDKKRVHNYAPIVVKRSIQGSVRIRPFFTVDSELSMNAVDLA